MSCITFGCGSVRIDFIQIITNLNNIIHLPVDFGDDTGFGGADVDGYFVGFEDDDYIVFVYVSSRRGGYVYDCAFGDGVCGGGRRGKGGRGVVVLVCV